MTARWPLRRRATLGERGGGLSRGRGTRSGEGVRRDKGLQRFESMLTMESMEEERGMNMQLSSASLEQRDEVRHHEITVRVVKDAVCATVNPTPVIKYMHKYTCSILNI